MAKNINPEQYVERLESALQEQADPEYAEGQKQYMKNKFEFFLHIFYFRLFVPELSV